MKEKCCAYPRGIGTVWTYLEETNEVKWEDRHQMLE